MNVCNLEDIKKECDEWSSISIEKVECVINGKPLRSVLKGSVKHTRIAGNMYSRTWKLKPTE